MTGLARNTQTWPDALSSRRLRRDNQDELLILIDALHPNTRTTVAVLGGPPGIVSSYREVWPRELRCGLVN